MFNINHIQVLGFLPFPYSSWVHSSNHSYSYLYPKLAKFLCLPYYLLCFPINKIREESGTGSTWIRGGGGGVHGTTMYTDISKYKNDKNRKKKQNKNKLTNLI
jgi:hypothetical protein